MTLKFKLKIKQRKAITFIIHPVFENSIYSIQLTDRVSLNLRSSKKLRLGFPDGL